MKQTTFSDLERNNKTCMYAHLIDSSIMTLFCILQALSGLQTWGYIIIFAVLGFGPVIAEFFFWNKSHETPAIQHLVAIGFAVFLQFCNLHCNQRSRIFICYPDDLNHLSL